MRENSLRLQLLFFLPDGELVWRKGDGVMLQVFVSLFYCFNTLVADSGPYYYLGEKFDLVTISKHKRLNRKDFLRIPVKMEKLEPTDAVLPDKMVVRGDGENLSKNRLEFKKFVVFGRLSRPRVRFWTPALEVSRAERRPEIDLRDRIYRSEKEFFSDP